MAQFNLSEYETVATRLERFRNDHPEGAIITDVWSISETRGIFKASVYFHKDDVSPVAVDFAEEIKDASPVNRTSWVENGLTSAIGRALADCGYAAKASEGGKRPSREEMQKVQRASKPAISSAAKPSVSSNDEVWLSQLDQVKTLEQARELYKEAQKSASKKVLDAITIKADTLK